MRRIPNFTALRAFEAAARLESFALAAHELHLTPSAISHQIRELESHFARPLFIRRNRRVEATPEGRRLFESLARVFDALEASCAEVTLAPNEQVLAVHCAPSLAVKWLGPRLPNFMQAHPQITIRLSSGAEPIDLTRVREVDVAISYGAAREAPGIEVTALGLERIGPLCAPALLRGGVGESASAGAANEVGVARLLCGLPLIDSQLSRVGWPAWFESHQLQLPTRPRVSFDRAALSISAAADGMGVALESSRLAEREIARGELVELGSDELAPLLRETHFYSQRSNETALDKVVAFRTWLLDQAGVGG